MIGVILIFLAVLSILVLAHEWGHYFTAKRLGAKVEEFSIGFPPRIYSWQGKDGMKWTLGAVPIGGFVKIKGEGGDDKEDKDSFAHKSIPARFLILAAGVIMNLVIAAVFLSIGFLVGLPAVVGGEMPKHAIVFDEAVRVTEVLGDAPAHDVLQMGDVIVAIEGEEIANSEAARTQLAQAIEGEQIHFTVKRGGDAEELAITPAYIDEISSRGVGIAFADTARVRYPWYLAPIKGIEATIGFTAMVVVAFYELIRNLILGGGVSADVAGPIGIAVVTGEVVQMGFVYLLQFAAVLSINLAILNILPFPALDGGRIAFLFYEAVRGKPVSPKIEGWIHNAGFALLIVLIVIVTYRDILTL